MNRSSRVFRWLMVVASAGILPAFVLRCDKAALNFQRGLFYGLGEDVAGWVLEQVPLDGDATE